MSNLQATGVLIVLFALRCIVPLLVVLGIGYLMNRLVDRWEAEAAAAEQAAAQATAAQPAIEPATAVPDAPARSLPCWVTRNCEATRRADCPAFRNPNLPCWQARAQAEGAVPANCPSCPIYEGTRLAF